MFSTAFPGSRPFLVVFFVLSAFGDSAMCGILWLFQTLQRCSARTRTRCWGSATCRWCAPWRPGPAPPPSSGSRTPPANPSTCYPPLRSVLPTRYTTSRIVFTIVLFSDCAPCTPTKKSFRRLFSFACNNSKWVSNLKHCTENGRAPPNSFVGTLSRSKKLKCVADPHKLFLIPPSNLITATQTRGPNVPGLGLSRLSEAQKLCGFNGASSDLAVDVYINCFFPNAFLSYPLCRCWMTQVSVLCSTLVTLGLGGSKPTK